MAEPYRERALHCQRQCQLQVPRIEQPHLVRGQDIRHGYAQPEVRLVQVAGEDEDHANRQVMMSDVGQPQTLGYGIDATDGRKPRAESSPVQAEASDSSTIGPAARAVSVGLRQRRPSPAWVAPRG